MGDARRREVAAAAAAGQLQQGVKLTPKQVMVGMLVDLVCHTALGAASQIGRELSEPGVADELEKAINHLQQVRANFFAAQGQRVVIAPASSLPKSG